MNSFPNLANGFILDEHDYDVCVAWLEEADQEIMRRPLGNPELDVQRRQIKSLLAEYETNWRGLKIVQPKIS